MIRTDNYEGGLGNQCEWFKAMIDLTDLDEDGNIRGRVTNLFGVVDGVLREEGKEQFGVREIAGCDREIVGVEGEGSLLAGL